MYILIPFGLILAGIGSCVFGYHRWKGAMHWSYFDPGFFQEYNYQAIPVGIAFMLLGLAVLPFMPTDLQLPLIFLGGFVLILGLIAGWRLFKPNWFKWVEENHKEIMPHLEVEVRDHGFPVKTQEELEEWITGVYKRYKIEEKR